MGTGKDNEDKTKNTEVLIEEIENLQMKLRKYKKNPKRKSHRKVPSLQDSTTCRLFGYDAW